MQVFIIKAMVLYRMLAKRFPYATYYEIKDGIAHVVAVLPMHWDPLPSGFNSTPKFRNLKSQIMINDSIGIKTE